MSLPQSQLASTTSQLFQIIQAQQAITPNPVYQPPLPSAPTPFNPAFSPYASHNSFAHPPSSNLFSLSAQEIGFGRLGNTQSIITPNCKIEQSKKQPDYYPASPAVDSEKTLGEFEHFFKLPVEIIGLVVEQCAVQDGVCLSLASKDMYTLARPILLRRDKEAYSLSRMSQYKCRHFLSKSGGHKPCTLKSCQNTAAFSVRHCVECTSCPLYVRLGNGNWSGLSEKTYVYCSNDSRYSWVYYGNDSKIRRQACQRFKLKRRFWKGQCLHGGSRPKPRKEGAGGLTWTHKKGLGGWHKHGRMWKTLYTEKGLHKFQNRYMEERKSSESRGGYSLRRKPKPTSKRVEHVNLLYGVDLDNPSGRGPVEGTEGWEDEKQQQRQYNNWGGTEF